MNKKTLITILIIAGAAILLMMWPRLSAQTGEESPLLSVTSSEWIKGNPDAKTTLIEYSDFQCPACRNFYTPVKEAAESLGDDIRIVYRHFPLPGHVYAFPAAVAAEAAGKQDKFWEMHDMLFENQDTWTKSSDIEKTFIEYAEALDLDVDTFTADLKDPQIEEKIKESVRTGNLLKVNATPTFFLNGKKMEGFSTFSEFKKMIEDAAGSTKDTETVIDETAETGE